MEWTNLAIFSIYLLENCIIKSDNNELKESEKILHKYYNLEDLGIYVIELIQAYIW